MINNYRTSFNNRHHSEALEYNLDHVVNQTQLKMKELINKKQEKIRENGQLKAQRGVLESDIAFYEREIKDKDEQLGKLSEEYYINQKEIEELEKEYSSALNDLNQQNENYKHTINFVNKDFDTMTVSNGIEETSKKSETKLEYESYMKVKSENKSLMDKLHDLRRELYFLEISYKKSADNEMQRIYKARKGLESMNKLEKAEMKIEGMHLYQDQEEEEEKNN